MENFNSIPESSNRINRIGYETDEEDFLQLLHELWQSSIDLSSDDDELPPSFFRETEIIEPVFGYPASEVYGFPEDDFHQDDVNEIVMGFPVYPNEILGFNEEVAVRHLVPSEIIEDHFQAPARDQVNGEQTASPPAMSLHNPNLHYLITKAKAKAKAKTITWITHVVAVWIIVFAAMLYGNDETGTLQMGMGSSVLLEPNRFYVDSITVKQVSKNNIAGPILYGFDNQPSLNVISNWSLEQYASLQANTHKEWRYFFNVGSKINISYSIPSSSRLLFTIDKVSDHYRYDQSLYDRSIPEATFYWTIIRGNGLIQQSIPRSGKYIIAVENLNSEVEEVQLNISAKALIYNTSEADYMCILAQSSCFFPVLLFEEHYALLTTPDLKQGTNGEWDVHLTYGPRYLTFFGGIVMIIGIVLVGIELSKNGGLVDHEEGDLLFLTL